MPKASRLPLSISSQRIAPSERPYKASNASACGSGDWRAVNHPMTTTPTRTENKPLSATVAHHAHGFNLINRSMTQKARTKYQNPATRYFHAPVRRPSTSPSTTTRIPDTIMKLIAVCTDNGAPPNGPSVCAGFCCIILPVMGGFSLGRWKQGSTNRLSLEIRGLWQTIYQSSARSYSFLLADCG